MTKNEIADVLAEIGTLMELKGENPFKVRAYSGGARAIEALEKDEFEKLVAEGKLQSVKGIGEALSAKIAELHSTGRLEFLDKLKASIPPGQVEMLRIPGMGPKKIAALGRELGVTSIAELVKACKDGRVAALDGFGEKTQEKILTGVRNREAYSKRHLWWGANLVALPILEGLRGLPAVSRAETAGSLRRGLETVGDLDFIVAAKDVGPVVEWFTGMAGVREVTAKGDTKASVRLDSGLQADLRIIPSGQFAFALHHFTGSKDHNVQMRQRALDRGLSLSEWGLVPAEGEGTAKDKAGRSEGVKAADEKALFGALGLSFIPPELREGLGEIEAAEKGEIPKLVEMGDLMGAFHNHTTESDGSNTLAEMAGAAQALGWEYLGIADHSKSSRQANGLTEERLLAQVAEIKALNASRRFKIRVFAGSECDILPDGRLDFADSVLAKLDYVVVSVHSSFSQDEEAMTARIIKAIENPRSTMLGHLTGRLLLEREPYRVDAAKVIDAAIANGVAIELNANPYRLDMDWRHWRKAAARGLECVINPDAHGTEGLVYVRAGINAARKGWLTRENVVNALPLAKIEAWLAKKGKARVIDARARGLANIHAAVTTLFVGVVFWAWAYVNLNYRVPYVHMNPYENLLPYFLCAIGGMLLSARDVSRPLAARFHLPDLGASARLAFRQVAIMALLIFALMFATQDHSVSRLYLGTMLVWCWLGLTLLNAWLPGRLARLIFQKGHRLPTVFIGKPGSFAKVREWISNKEPLGIFPVGLLSPESPASGPDSLPVPWLGTLADLPRVLGERPVGQVVMLELPTTDAEAGTIIDACRDHGCRLLIHSDIEERYSQPLVPVTEEGRHFYTLQEEPLEDPMNRLIKRSFDIAVSLPVVVLAMPFLCAWVAAMQAIQAPGPLFHARERRGKQGRVFRMLKFRSMFRAPDNPAAESMQALTDDQRIFAFGRFMRRRSLDEFPQFWNVLVGEMSIVGPRPYMPLLDEEFRQQTQGYRTRNLVKPGITGLSQSLGFRGAVLEEEMVRRRVYWDVYYISHWSPWMDLQITARTLWQVVVPPETAF